jgi:inosine-uridine nucleoside N-ribohydrolase
MQAQHKLVIDCDPGIDDALALLLAAASPEFDLLGVTCVAGNRPVAITADNACRVLDLAGRAAVEVHAGCSRPLAHGEARCNLVHGEDGLGGVSLPGQRGPSALHASDFLERTLLDRQPGEVTLVAVGPLTNLALAEIKRPGLLRRSHSVLVMGGAAFCDGNVTPSAEFNFYADALAAQIVLGSGAPIRLFGLDVTRQAAMTPDWILSLGDLGNRCGDAARDMLRGFARPNPLLHDTCPLAWLLAPELFAAQRCTVMVDWRPGITDGHLVARRVPADGRADGSVAEVFTSVQADGLRALLRQRLARLP